MPHDDCHVEPMPKSLKGWYRTNARGRLLRHDGKRWRLVPFWPPWPTVESTPVHLREARYCVRISNIDPANLPRNQHV